MAETIAVGNLTFATKKAAIEFYRAMLYRYPIGAKIDNTDAALLLALLQQHPGSVMKIGAGVSGFCIGTNAANTQTRGFYILRTDGSCTDFSYRKCIDKRLSDPKACVLRVLRAEVQEDIDEFKSQWFDRFGDADRKIWCPIVNVRIGYDDAHADHMPPRTFIVLAECFLDARGLAFSEDLLGPCVDMVGRRLADRDLAAAWVAYHARQAAMRVISKHANMKRSAESKVPKGNLLRPVAPKTRKRRTG